MKKPNILFIMTDQHWHEALGLGKNKYISTPNLDKLAAAGTVFQNACCAHPLCVPSRTCIMTGRMPHETGITYNVSCREGAINLPMLGKAVRDAGYDTGYAGKWHLPLTTEEKDIHGFDYLGHISHAAMDEQMDDGIPGACREFLQKQRTNPFFLVASFTNPHDICQWARGVDLPNGAIPAPPPPEQCPPLSANFEESFDEPPIIRKMQSLSPNIYPTSEWDTGRWRQYRWAMCRLVEKVDALIGEIIDCLEKNGQFEKTLIIFAADHGDGVGAHKWSQKSVLYEESIRVPFIIKAPSKNLLSDKCKKLVSTGLDIFPTICDYASADVPRDLKGLSLKKLLENGEQTDWRDELAVETEFSGGFDETHGVTGRAVRGEKFKYIVYSKGEPREQLFDIETDPGEMINLAGNEECRDILEYMETISSRETGKKIRG